MGRKFKIPAAISLYVMTFREHKCQYLLLYMTEWDLQVFICHVSIVTDVCIQLKWSLSEPLAIASKSRGLMSEMRIRFFPRHKNSRILPSSLSSESDLQQSWQIGTQCPSQHPVQYVQKVAGGLHLVSAGLIYGINGADHNAEIAS